MLEISLNMYHAVALGAFLFWLGGVITSKISLLNRYCIPAPLVGGLCFSIVNCILYSTGAASITFDDTLQSVFMIMFFTTVGFTVSIPALLKGGKAVVLCLLVAVAMIPVQNFLGGGTIMGGPTARRLIHKYGLRPDSASLRANAPSTEVLATDIASEDETFSSSSPRFVKGFMVLLLAVGIGNQVSTWLTALTGLAFPGYIGAMLVAVVVRNVMDGMKVEYPAEEIDTMGNMFLSIFLAMALAGLKLWELVDLALPMILCLVAQCVVMVLFSYLIVFRVMGRNYDAAVMTAGFIGFSMGATSNAMANMQVVTKKYGPSPVAYFAIPMVGGMFIDFFNAVLITFNIGLWAH